MSKNKAIEVKGLKKSYGNNEVLKGINLEIEHGTMLALLGPNGAGKTTTVRIMSTLLGYDEGKVIIDGYDLATQANEVRSIIGLTGQAASVDELLTGRENLVMMGRLFRLTKRSAIARAQELLNNFDLVDAADRPVKTYSGGMRRRIDLAVSLIAAPPIIFLDEPTTGLDPRSRQAMWDIIRNLVDGGTTVLLTTQYLEEADQLANKIAVIDGGKVIAEGTASDLKRRIGKDRLELTFKNSATMQQAAEALKGRPFELDNETHTVILAINDSNVDIGETLHALHKKSIRHETLSVYKPTLDDVFLTLTGKQKHSEEEEA